MSRWCCMVVFLLVSAAESMAGSSATSPRFVLDLRNQTKTVTGRILGNGSPLPNADVVLYGPGRELIADGKTDATGNFSLTFTRKCDGLIFHASYNPYISVQQDVRMLSADTVKNMGDIPLIPCLGDKVVILDPTDPANPAISEVEIGGTAYRYYRVAVKGLDNRWYEAGSREVQMRVNGSNIPQGTTNSWLPGKITGISDPDGLLRVEIPSSSLLFSGDAPAELLYAGDVIKTFTVRHKPRTYNKTASHEFSAGLSGVVSAEIGAKGTVEVKVASEIENKVTGGLVEETTYGGEYGLELKLGLGVINPGEIKLGVARVGAEATVGAVENLNVEEKFKFPNGIVEDSDKTKLAYLLVEPALYAMQSTLFGQLLYPAVGIYKSSIVRDNWEKTTFKQKQGVYGKVEVAAYFGKPSKTGEMGVDAKVGGKLQAVSQMAMTKTQVESSGGVSSKSDVSAGIGVLLGEYDKAKAKSDFPMPNVFMGLDGHAQWQAMATIKRKFFDVTPNEVALRLHAEGGGAFAIDLPFIDMQFPAANNAANNYLFDLTYTLSNFTGNSAATLFGEDAFWAEVTAGQMTIGAASLPLAAIGMFSTAHHKKLPMEFILESGANRTAAVELELGATLGLGLSLDLGGEMRQEATSVMCNGIYWEGKHYLNEIYPFTPSSEIPAYTTADAILEYWPYLANVVGEVVKEVLAGIASGEAFVVQLGDLAANGGQALFNCGAGAWSTAGQFMGGYLDGVDGMVRSTALIRRRADLTEILPQEGASNYVYGVGGVYYLNATNTTLVGSGTLTVQYSDEMAAGLDESDFRLYRQETSQIWALVASSVAVPDSNTVSGVITQLGCYAVAPAMPAGEITVLAPTTVLAVDGVSTATVLLTNLVLNTGGVATQAWLYSVAPEGLEILTEDADTNRIGHQVVSSNALATVTVRALQNATWASLSAQSVAGTAAGEVLVSIADSNTPPAVASVSVTAGQSRVWASWPAVTNQDVAGYRVYYRCGAAGPPYDGHAKVEGRDSPFDIAATNVLLAGLDKGSNYYVAVSAFDYAGNESPLTAALPVQTDERPPADPLGVSMRCNRNGSNVVMWTLSEDDGFNDRDVAKYVVSRAILPGGAYQEIAEISAGFSLFIEDSPALAPTQFVRYAVKAVDVATNSSPVSEASQFLSGTSGLDADGDGMDDLWEDVRGLDSLDPTDATADPDEDGWSNLSEFAADTDPLDKYSSLQILAIAGQTNGVALEWLSGAEVWHYVEATERLDGTNANWQVVYTQSPPGATNGVQSTAIGLPSATGLFYRVRTQRK